jgi:serine/threonine protein kinase
MRLKSLEETLVQQIPEVDDFVRGSNPEAQVHDGAQIVDEEIPNGVASRSLTASESFAKSSLDLPEPSPDSLLASDDFNWEPVMEILEDVTSGLIYIHGKNIVHRDLKPRNGT